MPTYYAFVEQDADLPLFRNGRRTDDLIVRYLFFYVSSRMGFYACISNRNPHRMLSF